MDRGSRGGSLGDIDGPQHDEGKRTRADVRQVNRTPPRHKQEGAGAQQAAMLHLKELAVHLLLAWCTWMRASASSSRNESAFETSDGMMGRAPRDFVVVANSNTFAINGRRFVPVGTNQYYMLTRAASSAVRYQAVEVLDGMEDLGLNTLRMWAFNDGANQWKALQTSPGQYSEEVFQGMDWNVAEAGRRGIKLILVFVNYWPEYGGMQQYVNWSPTANRLEDFYTDENCRRYYRDFVSAVVNRVNTITGVPYKDDPAIMAWQLANEARNERDPSGDTMVAWVDEMSSFIRSMDPNHLIATGSEGFFGPDQWLPQGSNLDQFARQWINSQVRLANDLEKPLVLEEFGRSPDGSTRVRFYDAVYSTFIAAISEGEPAAGVLFWHLAANDYPDYDGYTVYPVVPRRTNASPDILPFDDACTDCCDGKNNCSACNNGRGASADAVFREDFARARTEVRSLRNIEPYTARACAVGKASDPTSCSEIPESLVREAAEICIGTRIGPTDPAVIRLIEESADTINSFQGAPVDPTPVPEPPPPPPPPPPASAAATAAATAAASCS